MVTGKVRMDLWIRTVLVALIAAASLASLAAQTNGYTITTVAGNGTAGFSGDELPSDKFPNEMLLKKALDGLKDGDIFLAHMGIWSRQDPWAPAVLEPLISGLEQKGFCFATLREHPSYRHLFAAGKEH